MIAASSCLHCDDWQPTTEAICVAIFCDPDGLGGMINRFSICAGHAERGSLVNTFVKAGSVLGIVTVAAVGLAACSSSADSASSASPTTTKSTSSSSPSKSASPTGSGSSSPYVGATCTSKSIQSALPRTATVTAFKCGSTGDGQIAGVSYGPGKNIIFLQTTGVGGQWKVISTDTVCGSAQAGLPPAVLAFCRM